MIADADAIAGPEFWNRQEYQEQREWRVPRCVEPVAAKQEKNLAANRTVPHRQIDAEHDGEK